MHSLLNSPEPDDAHSLERMEEIRQAMLDTLSPDAWNKHFLLETRVMVAPEVMDLWFLRSDLMQAISTTHGELVSGHKLRAISSMFDGLLPRNMASRPSPLGN
jgi:hypothetical protein